MRERMLMRVFEEWDGRGWKKVWMTGKEEDGAGKGVDN